MDNVQATMEQEFATVKMRDDLAGKRIVILGLARQGRALARFAAQAGAEVIVSDLRSAEQLAENLADLRDLNIEFVLGQHPMSLLQGTDVVAISGGVPADAPFVAQARRQGIRVTNDSLEFLLRSPAPVIGVTGSAGKTTTTALTGAIGRASGRRTWVGGNIGRPLIGELPRIDPGDLVVQELSSFQLEVWDPDFGHEALQSPHIAAVLNITANHLDRHGTLAAYAAAKANILRHQRGDDVAVLCADDEGAMQLQPLARGRLRTFSRRGAVADGAFVRSGQVWLRDPDGESAVCELREVRLRGEHNLLNVLAAVTLAGSAGVEAGAMCEAIRSFSGVPHRLEPVATINGVQYINDSIATAPERALAALRSFDEPLVLLAGGRDKKMVWDEWSREVARRVRHVILFGDLAPMLERRLQAQQAASAVTRVEALPEAVQAAARVARAGDVVLLAPGGTSYDAYEDFEQRGEHFRELVNGL
ncbi:MAG TPA: UDP-N-acetylmuramoyl-L-alanine--D-glutamate ligase [Candidatus Sulfomarinibacteraceae bacterium]|nr:UDP-N-acetylmuramoyl-L-alanine--D-glutamate ligase [Candidatus Sulfomarinibacteraceae bacterium]